MDATTEIVSQSRTRTRAANTSTTPAAAPTYGYHNTYHTHEQLPNGSPPSYARATNAQILRVLEERTRTEKEAARDTLLPPPYSCTVEIGGVVGIKQELSSPFHVSDNRQWYDAYAILRGTQLSIYRIKTPGILSKSRQPTPGRLLHTYSLQHAEVGIASDLKKTALIPKSTFAHLVPVASRPKLYETDPQLFEPVREHAIRLRLELEQFLLCPPSQEGMLDWVEGLCAAIDISSPLEDRSEPRYRSLPRRGRRQHLLDGAQIGDNIENLSNLEAGRRIIAQQEQIFRQLYPHLAAAAREPASANAAPAADGLDDFDPEDVRCPTRSSRDSLTPVSSREEENADEDGPSSASLSDPKSARTQRPTFSQTLRYRRRCAPVLLASSPRVSDVVFARGTRLRISIKSQILVEYTAHPPRYDVHQFPKRKHSAHATTAETTTPAVDADADTTTRPASPLRARSDDSITSLSFDDDLAPAAEDSTSHEISSEGLPSPTRIEHIKADAARQLEALGKQRTNDEDGRETGVEIGVSLVI
ncbi:hypothetical protein EJ02DRAFT_136512 [Clathrospora elynae]|uniref:PH domain-containing protein n=1 Tax=Clathrospora elynae TaxID=706981 RepID=A0A6A5T5M2_9PLEO|nr:hypothetical protein EJ02DRAFT_136512 [Clathrospora elynae]